MVASAEALGAAGLAAAEPGAFLDGDLHMTPKGQRALAEAIAGRLRRSLRAGWSIPGGILAFLVASYLGHGALGLERYLTALLPFACVALADGVRRAPRSGLASPSAASRRRR